jgi:hypothetical protein
MTTISMTYSLPIWFLWSPILFWTVVCMVKSLRWDLAISLGHMECTEIWLHIFFADDQFVQVMRPIAIAIGGKMVWKLFYPHLIILYPNILHEDMGIRLVMVLGCKQVLFTIAPVKRTIISVRTIIPYSTVRFNGNLPSN